MSPIDQKPRPDQTSTPGADRRPDEDPALIRRNREGLVFTLLFAAALLSSLYPLPAKLVSGVFAVAALIWAIRYIIASARAKRPGPGIGIGIIGILACLWMMLQSLAMIVLYPQQHAYEECVSSALTEQAAVDCTSEHRSQLTEMIERLGTQPQR